MLLWPGSERPAPSSRLLRVVGVIYQKGVWLVGARASRAGRSEKIVHIYVLFHGIERTESGDLYGVHARGRRRPPQTNRIKRKLVFFFSFIL